MRKSLLRVFSLAALTMLSVVSVNGQETSVTNPTADTWVGTHLNKDGKAEAYGSQAANKNLEMRTSSSKSSYYYALVSFDFTVPNAGYKVKKATLRLTTRYKKGDSQVALYAFPAGFEETDTYNDVSADIATALAGEAVAKFKLNGYRQSAPTDGNVTEDYNTVDKWQNTVDVTDLVRSYANTGSCSCQRFTDWCMGRDNRSCRRLYPL